MGTLSYFWFVTISVVITISDTHDKFKLSDMASRNHGLAIRSPLPIRPSLSRFIVVSSSVPYIARPDRVTKTPNRGQVVHQQGKAVEVLWPVLVEAAVCILQTKKCQQFLRDSSRSIFWTHSVLSCLSVLAGFIEEQNIKKNYLNSLLQWIFDKYMLLQLLPTLTQYQFTNRSVRPWLKSFYRLTQLTKRTAKQWLQKELSPSFLFAEQGRRRWKADERERRSERRDTRIFAAGHLVVATAQRRGKGQWQIGWGSWIFEEFSETMKITMMAI